MTNHDPDSFLSWLWGPDGGGSAQRPLNVLAWAERSLTTADGAAFWRVVQDTWSSFDRIPHAQFAVLFGRYKDTAPGAPDLSGPLTVYRGQSGNVPNGLSWTTDRKVAEGFARGHRNIRVPNGKVIKREVIPHEIAFTSDDRDENEVVLLGMPE